MTDFRLRDQYAEAVREVNTQARVMARMVSEGYVIQPEQIADFTAADAEYQRLLALLTQARKTEAGSL
jgi:hypothetical protein